MLLPVIMAGGSGSRLWPLSRQLNPKQFLPLTGDATLFQSTLARLEGLTDAPPLLLCNEEHRFLAAEQLRQAGVDSATLMLEPVGRNTAPAIALAALQATSDGSDPDLMVLAADYAIQDTAAFHESVRAALPLAAEGRLVTFGIVPTVAETGYGYIQRGEALAGGFAVARFVEKPDPATAQAYLEGGEHYWNSGMFLFRASAYLAALERHQPEMLAACKAAVAGGSRETDFLRVEAEAFAASPAD